MRRPTVWTLAAIALLGGMQLVPIERSNPRVELEVPAPPEVHEILRRSCYDCHSNETRWPWYSRVAPVSWLVAYDVREARHHLNFSTWDRYGEEKRRDHIREVWEEVESDEMPLWIYLPLHPDARLSARDRETIRLWATQAGAREGAGEHRHDHD
ncbi:MAG: heme-binding domain-containing protein [Deltaproteobacteria bacterium]|nr:MAG: heme-binding domain-containing protein [Deltaproteobacteria bacterium]